MRLRTVSAAVAALALATVSCSENDITAPKTGLSIERISSPKYVVSPPVVPSVRLSEFHYDNDGTDVGEAIEISGPSGASLSGWKIVLYNGSNGAAYLTVNLSGTIPSNSNACAGSGRGVHVTSFPSNGIQNGDPDAIVLVDGSNNVVDVASYDGSFTAADGPAAGMVLRNIGVGEPGTTPTGRSLRRNSAGTWFPPAPSSFNACNDTTTLAVETVATVTLLPASQSLVPGATQQFTATARNSASTTIPGAMIGWNTSNSAVATVNVNGLVTAVAPGTAQIIAVATNGVADTSVVTVNAAPPPSGLSNVRFTEIHYDNEGTDVNEAIEIEGPAGGDLSGWKVVLYNQTGGVVYDTKTLSVTIPDMCSGRGVVVVSYPSNGIQNGPADGFALVNSANQVVEFLSYEGTLTATDGPATGLLSTDIGRSQSGSGSSTRTLQRNAAGTWYGPYTSTMGACNPSETPGPSIFFSGRVPPPGDPALPVGFQDQLFASLQDANGVETDTVFIWSAETPSIATIDQFGVMTAVTAGSATFRATIKNGTLTDTWTLPTTIATASGVAYPGNTEFGVPADSDNTDDLIITHPQFTSSYNKNKNIPNWVSYNLDALHFGPEDRCDCFTFDPAAAGVATPYTTNAYTGSAAINGFGIDRGHLARSADRTTGALDNARTYYFSNIIPQASDNNQGPWSVMEIYLGDQARLSNKEVYVIAGGSGNKGTLKNEGLVVIPEYTWKVAVIMPRDQGLANVDSHDDVEVIAVVMPNREGIRNVNWRTYEVTVDSVESLTGYDLLDLLPNPIEIAVESNTVPPVAATDGPYSGYLPNESIAMSGSSSTDADAGQVLTYSWNFGDGSTGTGANVSHAYATGGVYTVTLVVTDPLGLADTVTTTATVQTQAQAAAAVQAMISQLLADGDISKGNANSLNVKLSAAISAFGGNNTGAAVNQMNALLNEIAAMQKSGRLSPADAAALTEAVQRIIDSV